MSEIFMSETFIRFKMEIQNYKCQIKVDPPAASHDHDTSTEPSRIV